LPSSVIRFTQYQHSCTPSCHASKGRTQGCSPRLPLLGAVRREPPVPPGERSSGRSRPPPGPPREGPAFLPAWCSVRSAGSGKIVLCPNTSASATASNMASICQRVIGDQIDNAVGRLLVESGATGIRSHFVRPAGTPARIEEVDKLHKKQVERARYQAYTAQRAHLPRFAPHFLQTSPRIHQAVKGTFHSGLSNRFSTRKKAPE